jgi:hypothetical protein
MESVLNAENINHSLKRTVGKKNLMNKRRTSGAPSVLVS